MLYNSLKFKKKYKQKEILFNSLRQYGLNPKEWIILNTTVHNQFFIVNIDDTDFIFVGKISHSESTTWSEFRLYKV